MNHTTTKMLAAQAGVGEATIRRDIQLGLLRCEQIVGIKGVRIPVHGKRGANHYLQVKYPDKPIIAE